MKKYGFLLITILICSCSKNVLDENIFIPDENDPRLPAYTELGYNFFGAKYGDSYFLSSRNTPYFINYKDDKLIFCLHGYLWKINSNQTETISLIFSFPSSPIRVYQDLVSLDRRLIDLTNESCNVIFEKGNQNDTLIVSNGHLNFKRAKILRIDREENRAILSGTFDIEFLRNDMPEVISTGRFDFGVTSLLYTWD